MKSKAEKRRERRQRTMLKWMALNSTSSQLDSLLDTAELPFDIKEISNTDSGDINMLNGKQVKWTKDTIPKKLLKYFYQRYSLFHRFDSCWIDYEGFYSVTPEVIARHTALKLQGYNVVDGFCGVGGNAIQFALCGSRVLAIELDATRLACARHNAIEYGVEHLITFVLGDFLEIAENVKAYDGFQESDKVAVFLSPPWGGPEYLALDVYKLENLPLDYKLLHSRSQSISKNICFYMPRNTDEQDMITLADKSLVELEKTFLQDKFKVLQVYYGDLAGRAVV